MKSPYEIVIDFLNQGKIDIPAIFKTYPGKNKTIAIQEIREKQFNEFFYSVLREHLANLKEEIDEEKAKINQEKESCKISKLFSCIAKDKTDFYEKNFCEHCVSKINFTCQGIKKACSNCANKSNFYFLPVSCISCARYRKSFLGDDEKDNWQPVKNQSESKSCINCRHYGDESHWVLCKNCSSYSISIFKKGVDYDFWQPI